MSHQKEIIEKLIAFDADGIAYVDAVKQLQSEGYKKADIANASYSVAYDGKPNTPRKLTPEEAYLKKHPEMPMHALHAIKFDSIHQGRHTKLNKRSPSFPQRMVNMYVFGLFGYFLRTDDRYAYRAPLILIGVLILLFVVYSIFIG
ncbi:hypothetical protein HY312_00100 [Candidatus Saccharibacteria bacterium]|nr:hypothetical protein [Candidatus Saccharibacteria bacterium]